MLDNWINPTASASFISKFSSAKVESIITPEQLQSNPIKKQIALIGFGPNMHQIREAFYKLDFSLFNLTITDLGDIRNNDVSLMTAAYKELIAQDIFPIIIAPTSNASLSIANALKVMDIQNQHGIVTPRTNQDTKGYDLLSNLIEDEKVNRLSIIGYQKHYANPSLQTIPKLDQANLMSLGQLRDNLKEVEPILRELTTLSFDISSIRASDSVGLKDQSSIGLFGEEACKLLHYASSSHTLKSLHLFGFELEENAKSAAELLACLIWYCIAGRQAIESYSVSKENMDKYIVELDDINEKINFWKNENSERWWVEIPNPDIKDNLIPCSHKEYTLACQNKISDRLFHLLGTR